MKALAPNGAIASTQMFSQSLPSIVPPLDIVWAELFLPLPFSSRNRGPQKERLFSFDRPPSRRVPAVKDLSHRRSLCYANLCNSPPVPPIIILFFWRPFCLQRTGFKVGICSPQTFFPLLFQVKARVVSGTYPTRVRL